MAAVTQEEILKRSWITGAEKSQTNKKYKGERSNNLEKSLLCSGDLRMSASGFLLLLISAMSCCAAPLDPSGKTCDRPDINHGSMYYDYYFPKRIGTSVNYQCEINYLSHQRQYWGRIYCTDLGWDPEPKCSRQCSSHKANVENADLIGRQNNFLEGDKVQFRCKSNFQTQDGKTDGERTCLPNGEFTPAKCSRFCKAPELPDGKFRPIKNLFDLREVLQFECNKGFMTESKKLSSSASCLDRGWSEEPRCIQIPRQCGPPPVVQYGDTISFNKPFYTSGESVEYKCPEYYILKGNRIVRCLNGVWDEAPVCLEPCTAKEKGMRDNNIRMKWSRDTKLYLEHGDRIDFVCLSGYEAPPGTQMKVTCDQGKLEYPKCFKAGFCVLDQPTMITHKINYNVSTIVDNGQTITFHCNEETIPENNLEAKCESGRIIYPKCIVPGPCKISTEDLNLHNIQLLPSNNSDSNPNITHRHGTQFRVTCKSGFKQPNQEALAIECYDGEFRYPRCFAGKTCRIDQDEIDKNNLELDEVHDNEVYYEENERVYFKCKAGYYRKTRPIGKCSGETMIYPSCTAQSSG